ncbi:MAG: hypothetical protein AAGG81_02290, partial [Chlamydiota bacterium]
IENYGAKADTLTVQTFDDLEKVRILYNQVSDQISRIRRYRQNQPDYLKEIKEYESIHQKLKDRFKNDPNVLRIVRELQDLAGNHVDEENLNNYVKAVGILVDLTDLDINEHNGHHIIDVAYYREVKKSIQPTPIRNCGNSCYLNSDLQLILGIPALRQLLLADFKQPPIRNQEKDESQKDYEQYLQNEQENFRKTKKCLNKVKVAFQNFVIAVESKDQPTINECAKKLRDATYKVGREGLENDEHPFITFIENGCDGEREQMQAEVFINIMLNAAGYALRTRKHFFGDDEATEELKVCREETHETMIQLPLNQGEKPIAHTIQGLIDHQFSPMPVDAEDFCVNGKKVKKDVTLLQEAPEYLFVQVKRFAHSGLVAHKLHDLITFDNGEEVDFTKAMDKAVTDEDEGPFFYEVIGAVQHHGNIHGGHYTAMVKKGGEWQNCNDDVVDTSFGKSYPVGQKGSANLEKGYIYAFRRISKGSH